MKSYTILCIKHPLCCSAVAGTRNVAQVRAGVHENRSKLRIPEGNVKYYTVIKFNIAW